MATAIENLVMQCVYDLEWKSLYYTSLYKRYDIARKCVRFIFTLGVLSKLGLLFLFLILGSDDNLILFGYAGLLCAVLALGLWETVSNTADYVAVLSVAMCACIPLKLDASQLQYSLDNNLISEADALNDVNVILGRLLVIELQVARVPSNNKLAHKCQQQAYSKVRFDSPVTKA